MTTKSPIAPPLFEVLMQLKEEIFKTVNCVKPGIIQSYDSATGTAEVQVAFRQANAAGQTTPTIVLVDCPVVTIQGGGAGAFFPIKKGDGCLLLFADQNIDYWFLNGKEAALPASARMHDLSDGFVLVGVNSLSTKLLTPLLAFEGGIWETGGAKAAVNTATSKITIKNSTKNLATILGSLATTLNSLNSTLAAMTTATIAAGTTQTTIATYTATLTGIIADLAALLY